jgi:hypothetical protein
MKMKNVETAPEVEPAEPEVLPDEEERPRPSENDPFAIPGPKVNPTPKGKDYEKGNKQKSNTEHT